MPADVDTKGEEGRSGSPQQPYLDRRSTDQKQHDIDRYHEQASRLGLEHDYILPTNDNHTESSEAVAAKWVTPQDPVLVTKHGGRLPAVPVDEAVALNELKSRAQGKPPASGRPKGKPRQARDGTLHGNYPQPAPSPGSEDGQEAQSQSDSPKGASLRDSMPAAKTNPLFPPLPMYGPPTLARDLQCLFFRVTSAVLSFYFLMAIVLGATFSSVPVLLSRAGSRLRGIDPDRNRPFYKLELERKDRRREADAAWTRRRHRRRRASGAQEADQTSEGESPGEAGERFRPTEGGPDPLVSDLRYYARCAGLAADVTKVQTEDGFVLKLYHIYEAERQPAGPRRASPRKYPVLLIHGLLQSAGAYCCTDDNSLAFYLAKQGFDVWLGENRCGLAPEHALLAYRDPRMWCWNIRQMGVLDLPAFVAHVLAATGFAKLGLVCHSQGTTQTLVALAKEQRPELGQQLSVFCALAPAAYAGPLIHKMYFRFMQIITPAMFRLLFGIHAFIPFMATMHHTLPAGLYGALGYRVFAYLFDWSDACWERDLVRRMFQFSPTYVSSESMRWWLGRECFSRHRCILATRDEAALEDEEDDEEDSYGGAEAKPNGDFACPGDGHGHEHADHGRYAWYDARAPPMAFWVAGNDKLVDGRRLLKRFARGREPNIRVVHAKVIPEYEHLDVIWAMDAIAQVGSEVAAVLWATAPLEARRVCVTPRVAVDTTEFLEPDETKGEVALAEGKSIDFGSINSEVGSNSIRKGSNANDMTNNDMNNNSISNNSFNSTPSSVNINNISINGKPKLPANMESDVGTLTNEKV